MSDAAREREGFEPVKARLQEIAEAVGNDDMPLDEALDLFEEAVALGMRVSDLIELDVDVDEAAEADSGSGADATAADASPAATDGASAQA